MSTFRPPPQCPPDSEPTLPSTPSPALPYRAAVPVLDAEPDPFPPPHRYTSTACVHGEHAACRGTCKFCADACRCPCHVAPTVP